MIEIAFNTSIASQKTASIPFIRLRNYALTLNLSSLHLSRLTVFPMLLRSVDFFSKIVTHFERDLASGKAFIAVLRNKGRLSIIKCFLRYDRMFLQAIGLTTIVRVFKEQQPDQDICLEIGSLMLVVP